MQRALSVEVERGFCDLQGHQSRFSEFLRHSLATGLPECLEPSLKNRWQTTAAKFDRYCDLPLSQRQHLVAETRRLLHTAQQEYRRATEPPQPPKRRQPATQPLANTQKANTQKKVVLDHPLTTLTGIGPRNAQRLEKLGLYSVRDLLFYYPRDHIDYARQVHIRDLEPGETVTLVATVRRCTCFSSPRNPKLTILELVLKDTTGQLKLSRFFAGDRFRNRGWQEQQKRQYPPGAVLAASGLVKAGKYGITLDNPDLEVLNQSGDKIESLTVGRVVPVYPLTEGVQPDLVRRAVVAALPAARKLREPLPEAVRQTYDLVALGEAIAHIHFPPDSAALDQAKRRLIFDEFFYLQLGLLKRRQQQRQSQQGQPLHPQGELIERFHQLLPFEFTPAQQRVVQEIFTDLKASTPNESPCAGRCRFG